MVGDNEQRPGLRQLPKASVLLRTLAQSEYKHKTTPYCFEAELGILSIFPFSEYEAADMPEDGPPLQYMAAVKELNETYMLVHGKGGNKDGGGKGGGSKGGSSKDNITEGKSASTPSTTTPPSTAPNTTDRLLEMADTEVFSQHACAGFAIKLTLAHLNSVVPLTGGKMPNYEMRLGDDKQNRDGTVAAGYMRFNKETGVLLFDEVSGHYGRRWGKGEYRGKLRDFLLKSGFENDRYGGRGAGMKNEGWRVKNVGCFRILLGLVLCV